MEHMLDVLARRQLAFQKVDVEWAFKIPQSREAVIEWMREYLQPETFLSAEEAELYASLEVDGTAHQIAANNHLSCVRPALERDIKDALHTIETSNLAIGKQLLQLKAQRHVLSKFQETNRGAEEQGSRARAELQKTRRRIKQTTDLANEELLQTTTDNLTAAQHQLRDAEHRIVGVSSELLREDDQVLHKIERAAAKLTPTAYEDTPIQKVKTMCAKLIVSLTEDIRCRLDRVYLETLISTSDTGEPSADIDNNLQLSLEVELDSLYTEIGDLNRVFVIQDFQKPLIQASSRNANTSHDIACKFLLYAERSMKHILERAQALVMRYEQHSSQLVAINAVNEHLAKTFESGQPPLSIATIELSPMKAGRRTTSESERSLGGTPRSLGSSATEQLLLILGALPLSPPKPHKMQDKLASLATEASTKTKEGAEDIHSSTKIALVSHFRGLHGVQNSIHDSLLADTTHRTVVLCDQNLWSRKSTLESSNGRIGSGLASLNLEKAQESSKDRDVLVDRWATI